MKEQKALEGKAEDPQVLCVREIGFARGWLGAIPPFQPLYPLSRHLWLPIPPTSRLPPLGRVLTFFFYAVKQSEKEGRSLLKGLPAGFSWEAFTRRVAGSLRARAGPRLDL